MLHAGGQALSYNQAVQVWGLLIKQAAYLHGLPAICERQIVLVPVAAHGQGLQPPCQLHRLQAEVCHRLLLGTQHTKAAGKLDDTAANSASFDTVGQVLLQF